MATRYSATEKRVKAVTMRGWKVVGSKGQRQRQKAGDSERTPNSTRYQSGNKLVKTGLARSFS